MTFRRRILWNLQLSSVDKNTGKLSICTDSNWHFTRNAISCLPECDHYVIVPVLGDILDVTEMGRQAEEVGVKEFVYLNKSILPFDVTSSRFDWDSNYYANVIKKLQIHTVWENNPMLAMNWKSIHASNNFHLVTYNHWVDNEFYKKVEDHRYPLTYQFRQHEGYHAANKVGFNSQFGLDMAKKGAEYERIWSPNFTKSFEQKSFILPPILNENYIDSLKEEKTFDKVTFVFNHRLSSFDYYKNNWDECLRVWDTIKYAGIDFQVIVTDNSKKGIPTEDKRNYMIHAPNLSYEEYIKILWKSHIHLTLFRHDNGGMWSISTAEAILTNNIIVCANHSGYKEMLPRFYSIPDVPSLVKEIHEKQKVVSFSKNKDTPERQNYLSNYSYESLQKVLRGVIRL